jgi:hypothetical protein
MKKVYALLICMTVWGAALFAQGRRALNANLTNFTNRRVKTMRKNNICSWVISMALVMGFVLAGCGSSPAASAQTAGAAENSAAAPAQGGRGTVLEGHRFTDALVKENLLFVFSADTFVLYQDLGQKFISEGVFTAKDGVLTLHLATPNLGHTSIKYTNTSNGVTLDSTENPFLSGDWVQRVFTANVGKTGKDLLGVWFRENEEKKTYIRVYSNYAMMYVCDSEGALTNYYDVEFDLENGKMEQRSIPVDGASIGITLDYIIEDGKLKLGIASKIISEFTKLK